MNSSRSYQPPPRTHSTRPPQLQIPPNPSSSSSNGTNNNHALTSLPSLPPSSPLDFSHSFNLPSLSPTASSFQSPSRSDFESAIATSRTSYETYSSRGSGPSLTGTGMGGGKSREGRGGTPSASGSEQSHGGGGADPLSPISSDEGSTASNVISFPAPPSAPSSSNNTSAGPARRPRVASLAAGAMSSGGRRSSPQVSPGKETFPPGISGDSAFEPTRDSRGGGMSPNRMDRLPSIPTNYNYSSDDAGPSSASGMSNSGLSSSTSTHQTIPSPISPGISRGVLNGSPVIPSPTGRSPQLGSGGGSRFGEEDRSVGGVNGSGRDDSSAAVAPPPPKKTNPLTDLIETEKDYVDDLGVIIKKVASAWSRTNFPPAALDSMFRAVEAVYRINKALLQKLADIGPNPSSPKALGDLLMRWVDDIEPSYTRYSNSFRTDFDTFAPVQSNPLLPGILSSLSTPITLTAAPTSSSSSPTLDVLFSLPLVRLRYYKKLYSKLLKSTQPGRSDHKLLTGANAKLDELLERCDKAVLRSLNDPSSSDAASVPIPNPSISSSIPAVGGGPLSPVTITGGGAGTSPIRSGETSPLGLAGSGSGMGSRDRSRPASPKLPPVPPPEVGVGLQSRNGHGSSSASNSLSSGISSGTDFSNSSATTNNTVISSSGNINELERRLDTSRTLDIFTMASKKCKLQMNPPALTFTRALRRNGDVTISFIPNSDPQRRELVYERAHIFLTTDLFLPCDRMTSDDISRGAGSPGSDMWLLYPPLAGKHLKVYPSAESGDSTFQIQVMKKEVLSVRTQSRQSRDAWLSAFQDCIDFASNNNLKVKTDTSTVAGNLTKGSPLSPRYSTSASPDPPSSQASERPFNQSIPNMDSPHSSVFVSDPSRLPPPPRKLSRSPTGMDSVHSESPASASGGRYERRQGSIASGAGDFVPPPPRKQSMYGGSQQHGFNLPRTSSPLPPPPFPPPHHQPHHQFTYPYPTPHPQQYPHHPQHQMSYPPPNGYNGQQHPYMQQPPPMPPYGHNQGFPTSNHMGQGPSSLGPQSSGYPQLRHSPSSRSMGSISTRSSNPNGGPVPPLPGKDNRPPRKGSFSQRTDPGSSASASGLLTPGGSIHRSRSAEPLRDRHYKMPSATFKDTYPVPDGGDDADFSPPTSPVTASGPTTSQIVAQMKCKVFIQQSHQQWKALGTARLKLYVQSPTNVKQLVCEADKKVLISTIVLTDGVERVGKTGVAIELSDNGVRTGIIYMLQMKSEQSATGLFQQLLLGSDRSSVAAR